MNNNDNLAVAKNNISQNEEIIKDLNNTNSSSNNSNKKQNNAKPLIFNQVTRSDLLLFKEDFLKTMKEFKTEINNKMIERYESFHKLIEESNQKIFEFEREKNTFIQKLNFLEEKHEILSKISETTTNLKSSLNLHMIQIQNCQKDLSNMGFKYDKIISSNLMVPALIGPMCKFSNLKEYIKYNREEMSELNTNFQGMLEELKNSKKKFDEINNNIQSYKKNMEPLFQSLVDLKVNQLEKKIENNFELVQEKIKTVHIQNYSYVQNFEKKEKMLNEYLAKMEDIKKDTLENNEKMLEKTKELNSYTILKLEKEISETTGLKKSVLELANIFSKQKRSYGDDNLNENKKQVIMNFGNMIGQLIKDINNDKKTITKKNSPIRKFFGNEDKDFLKNNDIKNIKKEYIDANSNIKDGKNHGRKGTKLLTERLKHIYSSMKISDHFKEKIDSNNKQNNMKEKTPISNNQILRDTHLILNNNDLNRKLSNDSSQKSIHNNNKENYRSNNSIINNEEKNNNNESIHLLKISTNYSKEKVNNINIINDKNETINSMINNIDITNNQITDNTNNQITNNTNDQIMDNNSDQIINNQNNNIIINKNSDIIKHISDNITNTYTISNYNINIEAKKSKNEIKNNFSGRVNYLKDIKKHLYQKNKSLQIKKNIFRKEATNLSNTDRALSRNYKLNN